MSAGFARGKSKTILGSSFAQNNKLYELYSVIWVSAHYNYNSYRRTQGVVLQLLSIESSLL